VPVVVTGADSVLGTAVVTALLAEYVEVRATVTDRSAVRALVDRGVRTAVSDLLDAERLGAICEGAHTVIHLYGPHPVETLDLVLDAVPDTGVRRVVTVGPPDAPAGQPGGVALVVVPVTVPQEALVTALVDADRRA